MCNFPYFHFVQPTCPAYFPLKSDCRKIEEIKIKEMKSFSWFYKRWRRVVKFLWEIILGKDSGRTIEIRSGKNENDIQIEKKWMTYKWKRNNKNTQKYKEVGKGNTKTQGRRPLRKRMTSCQWHWQLQWQFRQKHI